MLSSVSRVSFVRLAVLFGVGSALSGLSASSAFAQIGFSFINIDPVNSDPTLSLAGFNDRLQVYGLDVNANVVRSGPNAQGFATLASSDPGFTPTVPYTINNSGTIVGYGTQPDFTTRAFVSVGNNLTLIPTLGDQADPNDTQMLAPYSNRAFSINNHGQVVGSSDTLYDDGTGNFFQTNHAFLYNSGTGALTDLGVIPDNNGNINPGLLTTANGINDAGDIVGAGDTQVSNGAFESHAFLYRNGQFITLGTINDTISSYATAINTEGEIIGESTFQNSSFDMHAFVHTGTGLLTPGDDIGTFGGSTSTAFYLNDLGQVVGFADDANGNSLPFLYQNSTLYNINDLIPVAGFSAQYIYGLNNNGQILGYGVDNANQGHYFVLSVPEPGSMAVMGIGGWVLGVGFLRRRCRQS